MGKNNVRFLVRVWRISEDDRVVYFTGTFDEVIALIETMPDDPPKSFDGNDPEEESMRFRIWGTDELTERGERGELTNEEPLLLNTRYRVYEIVRIN